jgi:hypothetical protein
MATDTTTTRTAKVTSMLNTPSDMSSAIVGGAVDGSASAIVTVAAQTLTKALLPEMAYHIAWKVPAVTTAIFCFIIMKLIELDALPVQLNWLRGFVLHGARGAVTVAMNQYATQIGRAAMEAKRELSEQGVEIPKN